MTTIDSAKRMDKMGRQAAFIDRDGVINEEKNYVHRIEDFVFLPGAIEGLLALQQAGFALVVITNQAGIGRGFYSEQDFHLLTQYMCQQLAASHVHIDEVMYCPHHSTAGLGQFRVVCECRKPAPGMILEAASKLQIDLTKSVLIGDKRSDIQAGKSAGVGRCVLVSSGHAVNDSDRLLADACCSDLQSAAAWLLASTNAAGVAD